MGRPYYYFAASLPMIDWNGKLSMTVEEYCSTASRLLSKEDNVLMGKLLEDSDADIETDNSVAGSWIQFNRNFRNEAASFRAQRAHKDPIKSIRGTKENDPWLREVIHEAAKIPNPLEAETLLDRTRWQFLDDLVKGHYYDLEFLICYGLKLKILQRHQEYRSLKGKDAFDHIRTMELPVDWVVVSI